MILASQPPLICIRPALFARTGESVDVQSILQYAERAEAMGFDGLFVGDRAPADAPAKGGFVYSVEFAAGKRQKFLAISVFVAF